MFKKLLKATYPEPLSNFMLQKKLVDNKNMKPPEEGKVDSLKNKLNLLKKDVPPK